MPDIFINRNKKPKSETNSLPPEQDEEQTSPPLENAYETLPEEEFPRQVVTPHSEPAETEAPAKKWSDGNHKNISLMNRPAGNPGLFTAFAIHPEGVTFEHQEEGEEIILLLRRHFITNVPWIILSLVMMVIPLILVPFLSDALSFLSDIFTGPFEVILFGFYYLMIIGFILSQFATWFYQVGIVTNIRVIDVDFNTLLARNIAYTDITDIVDTEAHQRGILQGMFNFGSVGLQTAGMKANFEFTSIPQPNTVVDTLSDLMRDQKRHGKF